MTEVAQELVSAEVKVEEVVKEVVEEVKKVEKRARVEVTDAEKYAATKIENDYLKVQMQMQQLSLQVKSYQDSYTKLMENLIKKYELTAEEYFFDGAEAVFKLKPQQPVVVAPNPPAKS